MDSEIDAKIKRLEQENAKLAKELSFFSKNNVNSNLSAGNEPFEGGCLSVFLKNSPAGLLIFDENFEIRYITCKISDIFNSDENEKISELLFRNRDDLVSKLKNLNINDEYFYEGIFIIENNNNSEELFLRIIAKKIEDKSASTFFLVLNIQDITEQYVAENAISKTFDIFQKVTDNLKTPIFVLNQERNKILFKNQNAMLLLEKLKAKNIDTDLFPAKLCTGENEMQRNVGEARESKYFEPKTNVWFQVVCGVIEWVDKKNVYLISAVDISEKQEKDLLILEQNRELENQTIELESALLQLSEQNVHINNQAELLRNSNTTKDKMFSIIGHDLRGPVGNVKNALDILIEEYENLSKEEIRDFIDALRESADSVFNLLANLLDWAKNQSGRIVFHPERLLINEIIEENILLFKSAMKKKNIKLHYEPEKEYYLFADENMLNTIIRNVISNAIKFTREGGNIQIHLSQYSGGEKDILRFSVIDDGVGIDDENISKVFDSQEHYTTYGTNNEKGSGLGVILCKEFIERHNGGMYIKSEKNSGTKFSFTLPL